MPQFELITQAEAVTKTTTGRRAKLVQEYLGYIEQLRADQAGRLKASGSESLAAVRRRLGTAARSANKDLVVRRVGDEVLFWLRGGATGRLP